MFLTSLDNKELLHVYLGKQLSVVVDDFRDKQDYFAFIRICANYVYNAVTVYYDT